MEPSSSRGSDTLPGVSATVTDRPRRLAVWILAITFGVLPVVFSRTTWDQFELPRSLLLQAVTPLALGFLILSFGSGELRRMRFDAMILMVVGWGVWLVVCTVFSVNPTLSWRGEYDHHDGSRLQLHYLLLFFAAHRSVRGADDARRLLTAFAIGCVVALSSVLVQSSGLDFGGWGAAFAEERRFSGALGNPTFVGALAVLGLPIAAGLVASTDAARARRAVAALGVGSLAGTALWVGLHFAAGPRSGPPVALPEIASRPAFWALLSFVSASALQLIFAAGGPIAAARGSALVALLLLFLRALAESGSRGAVLGLLAAIASAAALTLVARNGRRERGDSAPARRWPTPLVAAGVVTLVVVGVLTLLAASTSLRRFSEAVSDPGRAASESRMRIWRPAVAMMADRLLTGWGVDTFMTLVTAYEDDPPAASYTEHRIPQSAHCEPLQVGATMGLVGLALWLGLVAVWIRSATRRFGEARGDPRLVLGAMICAMIGYWAYGLVGVTAVPLRAAAWLLLAIASAAPFGVRLSTRGATPESSPGPAVISGLRIVAAAFLALAVWNGWIAIRTVRADALHRDALTRVWRIEHPDAASSTSSGSLPRDAWDDLATLRSSDDALFKEDSRDLSDATAWLGRDAPGDAGAGLAQARARLGATATLLVAADRQTRACRIESREPRYFWHLGDITGRLWLASPDGGRGDRWFERAESAYRRAIELNPRNAFASANLARLWALRYDRARSSDAYETSARLYRNALHLAPRRRHFIVDYVALTLSAGHIEDSREIVAPLERRSAELSTAYRLEVAQRLFATAATNEAAGRPADAAAVRSRAEALKSGWSF